MSQRDWRQHAALDVEGGIATLTIADAGSLNILGTPVLDALSRALDAVAANPDIRVLVLRGTGDKAFVGGADIKEMASLDHASALAFIDRLRMLCESVRQLTVPVIARMPGWCLGGGLELALACDLRIGSDTARLGMPEVKVGIPSIIHAALMPRLIGSARARWMLLTGELVDATQAQAFGLLDQVVPLDALDAEVARLAGLLAGMGQKVLAQQKRLLREWESQPLETAILNGVREFAQAFETGEPQHYMGEFLREKAAAKARAVG